MRFFWLPLVRIQKSSPGVAFFTRSGCKVGGTWFAVIFALGVLSVAGGAVFGEDFGASGGGVGIFRRGFGRPRCVWGVCVAPEKRGLGIGGRMLQTLLERGAAITGIEQILLSVAATQAAAIRLYRSLGFQSFGCEPRALRIGDRFVDEEYIVRRVSRASGSE